MTCGLHLLCEKWQADSKREGPFIESDIKTSTCHFSTQSLDSGDVLKFSAVLGF